MAVSAVVGGAALVGGQAYFANRAARAQARNAREAAALYREGLNTAAGKLDPYANTGEQALVPLSGLLLGKQYNPETGEYDVINQQARQDLFQRSPGYQFRLDQAQKAIQNSQAARGGLLSGGALKELDQFTQGIASDEYGNYINQLQNLTSIGQNAASNQAAVLGGGQNALANLNLAGGAASGQQYQNASNQIGSLLNTGASAIGAYYGAKGLNPAQSASSGGFNGVNTQLQSPTYSLSGR